MVMHKVCLGKVWRGWGFMGFSWGREEEIFVAEG
jgi:hypothetical protein